MLRTDRAERKQNLHSFTIYTAPLLVVYYVFITMIYKLLCLCGHVKFEDSKSI